MGFDESVVLNSVTNIDAGEVWEYWGTQLYLITAVHHQANGNTYDMLELLTGNRWFSLEYPLGISDLWKRVE